MGGWSNGVFFQCIFETTRGKVAPRTTSHPLTFQQKPRGVKGKAESILERLGRLDVEASVAGDQDEPKRRMILFECVLFLCDRRAPTLIPSQGS